jgi:hypothetical protein
MSNNFFSEIRAVYEIMWKNLVDPDRSQVAVLYIACALQFRSILDHRQSTFKETITICHIVHVAS